MKHSPISIFSAYSGVLMCDFVEMKSYIEYVEGRLLFCHEMGQNNFDKKIRKKISDKGDFKKAMDEFNVKIKDNDVFEKAMNADDSSIRQKMLVDENFQELMNKLNALSAVEV